MCWSWEVSLAFVTFQVLTLGYITYRNKYIDRWYVFALFPFAGQEFCQFILWAWGDIENVDPDEPFECNNTNFIVSKILIADAYLIPLTISTLAYKTSINTKKSVQFMWKYWFYFQLITYFIIVPWMMIDKECVSVGDNGHQKWPPLMNPTYFQKYLGEWPTTIIISIYYYPAICLAAIFYKPLWVAWIPALYGIASIVILFIFIGEEAYSVWCWSCACITLWVLMYVPIAEALIKNWIKKKSDNDQVIIDDIFGTNICSKIFFTDSHRHLKQYGMLNDEVYDYDGVETYSRTDESEALRNDDMHDL